ncbi:MAG TPA: efflux transporter outer membrane subunit [Kiloniellaceae bacterium]|nr:efflux transporter outer membrane subunit [Kiloniellaceae bacterium]
MAMGVDRIHATSGALRRWVCLGVIVSPLLLQGCTKVGPDFEAPTVPENPSWLEASDSKIDAQTKVADRWWQVFQDPVLDKLVNMAFQQNLTLQVAGLRILQNRANLGIAIGTQYPQVQQATGSYSLNRLSDNTANGAAANKEYGSLQAGLDASWELDLWGRFQRGIESADAALGASIAQYDDVLVSLAAEVAFTYVLIRQLEERIGYANGNVDIQRKTLKITDAQFKGGQVSELDVQQARALLYNTEALVPAFEASLRQAKNALSVLLGMPPQHLNEILGGPGKIPTAPKSIATGIPSDLLRRRPDIRQAELDAASQSARIGVAEADLYPRFTLAGFIGSSTSNNGGAQSNNANLGDIFDSDSFTGFIGPSVSLPIFNYGRLTNNVRVQDAVFQQLAINYQNTVLRAYQEVEDGLVGFLRAQDQAAFLQKGADASQRAVDLSVLQYREGLAQYTRVLNAQDLLVNQQDSLAVARGAIANNLISAYKGLGGGWEWHGENDYVPTKIQDEMRARTDWGDILPPTDLQDAPTDGQQVNEVKSLFRKPEW